MLRSQEFKLKRLTRRIVDFRDELRQIREVAPRDPALARKSVDALNFEVMVTEHNIRLLEHELAHPDDQL